MIIDLKNKTIEMKNEYISANEIDNLMNQLNLIMFKEDYLILANLETEKKDIPKVFPKYPMKTITHDWENPNLNIILISYNSVQ